jgi:hypothetical protein
MEALVASGATPEMLLAVVRAHEAAREEKDAKRRAKDAARQAAKRVRDGHAESRGVTRTERDMSDGPEGAAPATPTYAQVVNTTSSSLRSEEGKEPVSPDGDTPPLKPKFAKSNGFARFWEAYPNKVAKVAAEKAYAKAVRSISGPDPPGVILAGVERAKASRPWREGFIPHPATWLNRGSWEDQPAEIIPLADHERNRHHPAEQPTSREARRRVWAEVFAEERLARAGGVAEPLGDPLGVPGDPGG